MMIHRRSRPTVEERSKKATPNAVGVAHYAPLGAAGIMALIGPFCKPHVQRGVMIIMPQSVHIVENQSHPSYRRKEKVYQIAA